MQLYRFSAMLIKIPSSYFMNIDKLKLIYKGKRHRIANTILNKKNKVGGLILPDFKTYYKGIVIKTVWYW